MLTLIHVKYNIIVRVKIDTFFNWQYISALIKVIGVVK